MASLAAPAVLVQVGLMAMGVADTVMAGRISAPTIAIITMGNLDPRWFWPIVLITGLSNTLYTVVSGVRGVIVTEAIQMLVMMLGISATIAACWRQLPVSMSTAVSFSNVRSRLP